MLLGKWPFDSEVSTAAFIKVFKQLRRIHLLPKREETVTKLMSAQECKLVGISWFHFFRRLWLENLKVKKLSDILYEDMGMGKGKLGQSERAAWT